VRAICAFLPSLVTAHKEYKNISPRGKYEARNVVIAKKILHPPQQQQKKGPRKAIAPKT
jgi:hypothetical protein